MSGIWILMLTLIFRCHQQSKGRHLEYFFLETNFEYIYQFGTYIQELIGVAQLKFFSSEDAVLKFHEITVEISSNTYMEQH
jgi:hypothetical protein